MPARKGAGDGVYELSGGSARGWRRRASSWTSWSKGRPFRGCSPKGACAFLRSSSTARCRARLRLPARCRPRADFDLSLKDELGMGDPMRLRFQVDDGKIKLGRLADLFRRPS